MNGFILSHGDQKKEINFSYNSRRNDRQHEYFNELFDDNLLLRGNFDEFSYFGGFRCAKSFSQQLSVFLICLKYPKTKAIYIRDTYDQLKDSVIKQFRDEFEYLGAFEYRFADRVAKFKNGSELRFRAFDKDTNILSAEYDLIAVCQAEDIPKELFLQLIGRSSGRVLGRKGVLLLEGNPASGWAKERWKDQPQEVLRRKRICFVEGKTTDNPHVTPEYVQSLIDNYPKFWLDRYLWGLWDNRDELVISEFNERDHVIDMIDPRLINPNYKKRNGFDWGYVNPVANVWGYVDYDGRLDIYDEYYQSKQLEEYVAKECLKHGKILTVADHSMKGLKKPTKSDENITVWSELERHGMLLMPCNKEELSNIILTNSLFKQGKLKITKNCVNLITELKNWKWKRIKLGSDRNAFEEPMDKDNHACDALNYLVAELFGRVSVNAEEVEAKKHSLQHLNTMKPRGAAIMRNS